MVEMLIALGVLGVVLALAFTFVWRADAKRAEEVGNDEERLDTGEDESQRRS